ncbi:family 1 glycosylhydrolase [bacterium]|nr:family 1 glycosylhydrolase [bacterium]
MTKTTSRFDSADQPFLWGVATSAFQIEGHLENDMTEWERLGKFSQNGKDPHYKNAVDHWQRWEDDFALLKQLNLNAYRFSMDWGRIQPQKNRFDEEALAQYDRMLDRLLELNIIPMLTLHHFTHPVWFHHQTPWHAADSIEAFSTLVKKLAEKFADRINLFVSFNEPLVWALAAYGDAKFPPGEKNLERLMMAIHHILLAHRAAYDILKTHNPNAQIGMANNFIIFRPERAWHLLDQGLFWLIHSFYNMMLLKAFETNRLRFRFPFLIHYDAPIPLDNKIDFWGVNYYYRLHVRFQMSQEFPIRLSHLHRSGEGSSDLDWEIYSAGLQEIFRWLKRCGKPLYITENGIADQSDRKRLVFLRTHLKAVERALREHYPLKGYFHWSLLDNYEWLEGEMARFGLYEVDYQNGKQRKLRPSGKFYAEYIAQSI